MDKKIEVKIYLDAEIKKQLQAIAKKKKMPFSTFIRETMEKVYAINYLDKEIMGVQRHSEKLSEKMDELKEKLDKMN